MLHSPYCKGFDLPHDLVEVFSLLNLYSEGASKDACFLFFLDDCLGISIYNELLDVVIGVTHSKEKVFGVARVPKFCALCAVR